MVILLVSGHRGSKWMPSLVDEHADALGWLEDLICKMCPSQIWHGGATGVDQEAHRLAAKYEIDAHVFAARWSKEGRAAGAIRNKRMAKAARDAADRGHAVTWAIMPGGPGTSDARRQAKALEITVLDAGDPWPTSREG